MKRKEIQELITDMTEAGLTKLAIKQHDGFEITLERQQNIVATASAAQPALAAAQTTSEAPSEALDDTAQYVESPIVGTFYTAPSPDAEPFVQKGDTVSEDTVVCIIEAMKVMNEIKAGCSGTIAEVLMTDGHPVEFGAKMLKIV